MEGHIKILDSSGAEESDCKGISTSYEDSSEISFGDLSLQAFPTDNDEVRKLKVILEDKEKQCRCLKKENERINDDLTHERCKAAKLHKKLQFIKDNQEIFIRLKEAYINLKYNEAAGKKMAEITERGIQTYGETICRCCVESEEMRKQVEKIKLEYSNSVVIRKEDYVRMQDNLEDLKLTIQNREKSWSTNLNRERAYRIHISNIESENNWLRDLLKKRKDLETLIKESYKEEKETEAIRKLLETKEKELYILKRIIVKYEKRFRENSDKFIKPPNFSDIEKTIVDVLISKYYEKLCKKLHTRRSISCDRQCSKKNKSSSKLSESKSSSDMSDVNKNVCTAETTQKHSVDFLFKSETQ